MTSRFRLALFSCLAAVVFAAHVDAAPITVAEFRWEFDPAFIPGDDCSDQAVPGCEPSDPISASTFMLTGLWDYADVAAPTLSGFVGLSNGSVTDWLPTSAYPFNFDQFVVFDPLNAAATTIFFEFLGETRSLSASLTAPGFALLSFDYEPPVTPPSPVPEPGTLGLLGIGLAALSRCLARRRQITHSPRS